MLMHNVGEVASSGTPGLVQIYGSHGLHENAKMNHVTEQAGKQGSRHF